MDPVERLLLLRELKRVLQLLCGEDWRDVFADIIDTYVSDYELEELEEIES